MYGLFVYGKGILDNCYDLKYNTLYVHVYILQYHTVM
jgi:hypothetical protein